LDVCTKHIRISTSGKFEIVDITSDVERAVQECEIRNGLCLVFAPHATAAIVANEHEAGLLNDLLTWIKEHFQPERAWNHNRIDDNAHAHLASSIMGSSRIFPVINGRLVRGTWQNILFIEMDGPRRSRDVIVMIIGSKQ